jgi:hypothetical protein
MRCNDHEDDDRPYFRSRERLFTLNGQWYFSAREGDCGPFHSRKQALIEVDLFICEPSAFSGFEIKKKEPRTPSVLASVPVVQLSLLPLDVSELALESS